MANESTILPEENLATEDDSLGTDGSETRQFVTFMSGNEVFAVDMAPVQEIIRIPQMVRVPLAPPALEGLSNLRGKVLPIGGLKEKLLAALRAGIFEAILPRANEKDIAELPDNIKNTMKLHFVDQMDEVLALALERPLPKVKEEAESITTPITDSKAKPEPLPKQ